MVPSAAERVLRLAAYLDQRRNDNVTVSDISRDISGYDDGDPAERDELGNLVPGTREWEAIRKKLGRDFDDLRDAWGIDVIYDEADHCYRLARPFLSARERAALISAAAVVAVEGLTTPEPGAIGAGVDDGAARVVVQVHSLVGTFRDAIATHTPLRIRHEGRVRVIEPWALGVWRNKWYVAGGDPAQGGDMRRFRLDRVQPPAADGTPEPAGPAGAFAVPEWFDVDKAFDFDPNSWGHDAELHARVRVEADHLPAFLHEFESDDVEQHGDIAVVGIVVRHHESFRNRLLGFRTHTVVESPPELVTLVHDHLAAVTSARTTGEAG